MASASAASDSEVAFEANQDCVETKKPHSFVNGGFCCVWKRLVVEGIGEEGAAAGDDAKIGRTQFQGHHPAGDLFATVQERDGLGDNLVPDYFTRVQQGAFYGWPYSYIGQHPQPGFAQLRPDKVKSAVTPDVLFQAHSAPLGIAFYTANQFPSDYKGDAFVALHGSWNRSTLTGYKVVRLVMKDGKYLPLTAELAREQLRRIGAIGTATQVID